MPKFNFIYIGCDLVIMAPPMKTSFYQGDSKAGRSLVVLKEVGEILTSAGNNDAQSTRQKSSRLCLYDGSFYNIEQT